MTNKKKFNFPESLLKQIDECSFGGYIMFNFSSKGEPQVYTKFDNQINAMALLYYVNTWSQSVDQLNLEATTDQIAKKNLEEDDFDDSEDDKD
ncbi:MAG: hypothetical protein EBR82_12565 [Caulobacteraceae bacterium]|nr:hypothetical protein [Caulobacteraceae bacterium]